MNRPTNIPERILLMGQAGSGKTSAWINISSWSPDSKFYVLDTDCAVPRMLTQSKNPDNITIYSCYEWDDYRSAAHDALSRAETNDWIIIDMIGTAWETVQTFFTQQVFNQNLGEYFLQVRKALTDDKKSLEALSGWTDWSVINALYRDWINPIIFKSPANLIACTSVDPVIGKEDRKSLDLFGSIGLKPHGQKLLPYQFHTIAFLQSSGPDYYLNTIKDRERELVEGQPLTQFALQYLKGVAGWEM